MASNCMTSLVVWTMASHLKWFNIVAEYTLFVLVTYLTDAWGVGSADAAIIINVWAGISKLLTLLGAFMVDKIGNYRMLLYSSILYSIGLAFLYMSTPPVLANMAGNCDYYRPECFGPTQTAMFYISLVLTCLGTSGHTVSLDPFLDEQSVNVVNKEKVEGDNNKEKNAESCCSVKNVVNNLMRVVISGVSSWFMPDNWGKRLAIVAIYGFVATILFAIGTKFYETKKEGGTKIKFCDMFHQTSLVWPSFIMCGVVLSIGNTFFVEQADKMIRPKAGVYTVPIGILLLLANAAKFILKYSYQFIYTLIKQLFNLGDRMAKKCFVKGVDNLHIKDMAALVGLGIAMLNAVLCCLSAAVVENVRHKNTMQTYLHHDSIFWLVPQFVFVIGIDAFLQESVKDFFENYGPLYVSDDQGAEEQSMKKYIIQFTNFVIGLGFIGSVVSVLAVAKISKSVTGKSWIKREINDSHLEKYYWVLTVLSGINIIYYVVGAICYSKKIYKKKQDIATQQKTKEKSGCCPC